MIVKGIIDSCVKADVRGAVENVSKLWNAVTRRLILEQSFAFAKVSTWSRIEAIGIREIGFAHANRSRIRYDCNCMVCVQGYAANPNFRI